ncbi:MAG TPA: translocation/assembly module TamB domain-containing protein [Rudaea sp.]|nr:translocation/assembly module TamB domain-containing protein [Rudaea sp.]
MRTWTKRIVIAIVIVLALIGVFAWWLLGSESGARFALARAEAALDSKLSVAQLQGKLSSPLQLHDVRYLDPESGIEIRIQNLKLEYSLYGLISRSLHVRNLEIDGVDVRMHTLATPPVSHPSPSVQSLLTPPLTLTIDRAHVADIAVAQDGKPVFVANSLDLAASWTKSALAIRQLALRSPDGHIDLSGSLESYRDYRGKAQANFDWRIADQRAAGTLLLVGNGKSTTITLALDKPTGATAKATIIATAKTLPWTLNLDIPKFDPSGIGVDSAKVKSLALHLQGSGDRQHGGFGASVDVNEHRVVLDPFELGYSANTLTLKALTLRGTGAGTLSAQGALQLDTHPLRGQFDATWKDVELPADLFDQTLESQGAVQAQGSAEQFSAQGEFSIGPHGNPARIALKLDGTPQKIVLQQLDLKQPDGGMTASGSIVLQPRLGWAFDATAKKLNPGAFVKDWPGALDFTLSTNGTMEKDGAHGKLLLDHAGGALRHRAVHGSADLAFAPPLNIDGQLDIGLGKSSIALTGTSLARTDLKIDLAIASLGDWLAQAQGALRGSIAVKGNWPQLDATGKINGKNIVLHDARADSIALTITADDLRAPTGRLSLTAEQLSVADYLFDTVNLDAHGKQSALAVKLTARGSKLAIDAAMNGSATRDKSGKQNLAATLTQLDLAPGKQPEWTLHEPVAITYANGDFDMGDLCLSASPSRLCVSAAQSGGSARGKFSISQLPLAAISNLLSPDSPTKLDGIIDGNGSFTRAANGALDGHARIDSASGSIAYPDDAHKPLIAYSALQLDATLGANQSSIVIRSKLNDRGHLDGHVMFGAAADTGRPLSGEITAHLENLGIVDLLSGQTASTKGTLSASLKLSGTTRTPDISGDVALADFGTEVPAAGLKLHDGHVQLRSNDGQIFVVDGTIGSGSGTVTITGDVGANANAPLALRIRGENFVASDIPGAKVHISPDLTLTRKDGQYTLRGGVTIPKADVDLSKLPGGGSAATSPDVVITDAKTAPEQGKLLVDADITVKLGAGEKLDMDLRQGQEVHLVGFGLNGYLGGQIAVRERPGQATTGRGQVVVNGTYKAYGQDLKINQGRLLFAGTPVDNPGLDIRATRSGFTDSSVTVGLQVRGTAQRPILTVFSDPVMEQSDALSYLVAGKPLGQLKSGEGDAVGSAARALGTAGGDLLAKSIGSRLGFDDVGVADNSAVGGAALTIGKYLSPRLYLSYGVGLFTPGEVVTLRYRLSRMFNIEILNGTLSSRAGINYKIEK